MNEQINASPLLHQLTPEMVSFIFQKLADENYLILLPVLFVNREIHKIWSSNFKYLLNSAYRDVSNEQFVPTFFKNFASRKTSYIFKPLDRNSILCRYSPKEILDIGQKYETEAKSFFINASYDSFIVMAVITKDKIVYIYAEKDTYNRDHGFENADSISNKVDLHQLLMSNVIFLKTETDTKSEINNLTVSKLEMNISNLNNKERIKKPSKFKNSDEFLHHLAEQDNFLIIYRTKERITEEKQNLTNTSKTPCENLDEEHFKYSVIHAKFNRTTNIITYQFDNPLIQTVCMDDSLKISEEKVNPENRLSFGS